MKTIYKVLLLIAITSLLLPACGTDDTPSSLAVPGELTLVYIYTDG